MLFICDYYVLCVTGASFILMLLGLILAFFVVLFIVFCDCWFILVCYCSFGFA